MGGRPSRVKITGPLIPYTAGFREELEAQGYRPLALCDQLRLMAHMSRWMAGRGLDVGDLTPERVDEFLVARRAAGYTLWLSPKGVAPLLSHLRDIGAAPLPIPPPATPVDDLLAEFRHYLLEERGIAPASVVSYLHIARLFLDQHAERLDHLNAGEVMGFVTDQCGQRSGAYVVCGLRSFLRWCHLQELTPGSLVGVVPSVATRRLASLPMPIDAADAHKLLESCNRRTTVGRRDFAVLTVLLRLGLRAGEVASLELADVDWCAGELVVRGKGPRVDRLPLPADVGGAVAGWLRRGRGKCPCPNVFTRVRAPRIRLTSSGISAVVYSACGRAGLPKVSAHRLRHTAATDLLRSGSTLAEVGQVLRHQRLLTTSIYAKVDRLSLSEIAQPWPGGAI